MTVKLSNGKKINLIPIIAIVLILAVGITSVLIKKNEFIKAKKSMPLTDQNLATFCEKPLNEELAVALGIKLEDIEKYIAKHSK